MTIYAIQRGCYSDKHIIACTTNYEKAQKIKEIYSKVDDDTVILTFEDGEEIVLPMFEVCIENGVCDKFYTEELEWVEKEQREFIGEILDTHILYIRAESKEVAEKIAEDLFAEWKAQKLNLI
jgi:hypothetical protein